MQPLRERFDDPFEAMLAGVREFGLEGEQVVAAERVGYLGDEPPSDPCEYLREFYIKGWWYEDRAIDFEDVWEYAGAIFSQAYPAGFRLDYKWHGSALLDKLAGVLSLYGYDLHRERLGSDGETTVVDERKRPQVIRCSVSETGTNDDVARATIRLPAVEHVRSAVSHQYASAALANRAVLGEVGLETVRQALPGGDYTAWFVVERATLDWLQDEYGPGVELFRPGEELVRRDFLEEASLEYSPDREADGPDAEGAVRLDDLIADPE